MADFDLDGFLRRRANPGSNKLIEVESASIEKQMQLQKYAQERDALDKANQSSWVNKLGLDPDSFIGGVVNTGASVVSGAARTAGHIVSAPSNIGAKLDDVLITDQDNAAYQRYQQDKATPEDLTVLGQRKTLFGATDKPTISTTLQRIQRAEESRHNGGAITGALNLEGAVNQDRRYALIQALKEGSTDDLGQLQRSWDTLTAAGKKKSVGDVLGEMGNLASSIGGLAVTAGKAAITQPGAALEYIAENTSQLAVAAIPGVGPAALVASNVGYGADLYQQGIRNHQAGNDGALPSQAIRNQMSWDAIKAAGVEQASDLISLGAAKVAGKVGKEVADGVAQVSRTGFKEALLNTGKAAGKSAAVEAPTEGYQTKLEGDITFKPASAQDIYVGTAIGGIAGAGLGGGGRVLGELLQATPEHAQQRQQEARKALNLEAATVANDPSAYLDSSQRSFDPVKAVEVYMGHTRQAGVTPEVKADNLAKADQVLADLDIRRTDLNFQIAQMTVAGVEESIQHSQALLANPANAAYADKLNEQITHLQATRDSLTAEPAKVQAQRAKEAQKLQKEVARIDEQLTQARKVRDHLVTEVTRNPEVVTSVLAAADAPVDAKDEAAITASQQAGERLLVLSMRAPEQFNPEDLARIANNTGNGLTEPQRAYLRTFSATRIAENALRDTGAVTKDILEGSKGDPKKGIPGNQGITQYRQNLNQAVILGNRKVADALLAQYGKFAAGHREKAEAIQKAFSNFEATGQEAQLHRTDAGWQIVTDPKAFLSDAELRTNGGLNVNQSSGKLMPAIAQEARILQAAQAEFTTAYNMKFAPDQVATVVNSVTTVDSQATPVALGDTVNSVVNPVNHSTVDSTVDSVERSTPSPAAQGAAPAVTQSPQTAEKNSPPRIKRTKEEKAEIRALNQEAREAGVKGLRGRRKKEHVLRDIARVQVARAAMDPSAQRMAKHGERLATEILAEGSLDLDAVVADLLSEDTTTEGKQDGITRPDGKDRAVQEGPAEVSDGKTQGHRGERRGDGKAEEGTVGDQGNRGRTEAAGSVAESGVTEDYDNPLATEDTTEAETPPRLDEGKLSLFNQPTPPNTPYTLRNLIAYEFQQKVGSKEDGGGVRPLVRVKDFLTQYMTKGMDFSQFLPKVMIENGLTDAQATLMTTFKNTAMAWFPQIQANLAINSNPEYFYKNPVQFLIQKLEDGTLDLEENVKTAMVYAGFSWVAEQGSRSPYNTASDINAILGRRDDASISPLEAQLLEKTGILESTARVALGRRTLAALGLKVKATAGQNLMPQLEAAMGAYVAKLLVDMKVAEPYIITAVEAKQVFPASHTQKDQDFRFLRLKRDARDTLVGPAQDIYTAMMGTQNLLDSLFKVNPSLKAPVFEAPDFTQTQAQNSVQNVPEGEARILEERNKQAYRVRPDMWRLVRSLAEVAPDALPTIAGFKTVDEAKTHVTRTGRKKAKNDSLKRESERFQEFLGNSILPQDPDGAVDFFLPQVVWNQQRVGIESNIINPQTGKLHRFMVYQPEWEVTVDTQKIEEMDSFKLRVLEGLGVRSDRAANVKSLARFEDMFDEAADLPKQREKARKFNAAIDALMHQLTEDTLTAEQAQAIVAGVEAGGQAAHSLDALMAMAAFRMAQAAKQTHFITYTVGEIDGVTNGPMLAHMMLGASPVFDENASVVENMYALLNKGGFFELSNAHDQFNLWREAPGHLDLYETTTRNVLKALKTYVNEKDGKSRDFANRTLSAIQLFTGKLYEAGGEITKDGRNIIKTPTTEIVFGSSVKNTVDSMADEFIEKIIDAIEAVAEGSAKEGVTREAIIDALNILLWVPKDSPLAKVGKLSPDTSIEALLKWKDSGQYAVIKSNYKRTFGKAVKTTLEKDFATFIARRNQLNQAAQTAFLMYDTAYQAIRQQYVDELTRAGKLPVNAMGQPVRDLSLEEEAEVKARTGELFPQVHTPFSQASDDLSSGLAVMKQERETSMAPAYEAEVKFGTTVAGVKNHRQEEATGTKARGQQRVFAGPGVAMAVLLAHSADSATTHMYAQGLHFLNVHDARITGLNSVTEVARNLNESLWKVMRDYSPLTQVYEALSRTLQSMAKLVEDGKLPEAALDSLALALAEQAAKAEVDPEVLLGLILSDTKAQAHQADKVKYATLKVAKSFDQYAFEGGNYPVSPEDRAEVEARESTLNPQVPAEDMAALGRVMQALEKSFAKIEYNEDGKINLPRTDKVSAFTELEGPLKNAEILKLPGIQVMQLIDHVLTTQELTETVRTKLTEVLNVLRAGGTQVKTVMDRLIQDKDTLGVALQTLTATYQDIKAQWKGWELGEPAIKSDPALVKAFSRKGSMTANEALKLLQSRMDRLGDPKQRALYKNILAMLHHAVPHSTQLVYVTPATDQSLILEKASNSRGWYHPAGKIYVLSPEFQASGLTDELLVHELIHAALFHKVENETNPAALELIQELKALQQKAQDFVKGDKKLERDYQYALADFHEFLAWGLTNRDFQTQVLEKLTDLPAHNPSNGLLTGLKKFIEAVTQLLFGKRTNPQLTNGLELLVTNASGLFKAAAESRFPSTGASRVLSQINTATTFDYTTHDILNALSGAAAFNDQLNGVLTGIVEKLHGPFGSLKEARMAAQAQSAEAVWDQARNDGAVPFADEAMSAGFPVTDQEAFVLEEVYATVQATLDTNDNQTTTAYRELSKLYREVRGKVTPSDFNTGDPVQDQALYDFLFKMEAGTDKRSDHLARFAAMGLAHQGVHRILGMATETLAPGNPDTTVVERLQRTFERLMNWFVGKLTHTHAGQEANKKLTALVDQLVRIEAKRREVLPVSDMSLFERVEDSFKGVSSGLMQKVDALGQSAFFQKSRFSTLQASGSVLSTVASNRVAYLVDGLKAVASEMDKNQQSLVAGILDEMQGVTDFNKALQVLFRATKNNERLRKEIITHVSALIRESFDASQELTKEESDAGTYVFLRTGLHSLLEPYGLSGIQTFLNSKSAREKEIRKLEGDLAQFGTYEHYFLNQAKATGYDLVEGIATNDHTQMNAAAIARLAGTGRQSTLTPAQEEAAEAILDRLITLYALRYSRDQDMVLARQVMNREAQRGESSGVAMTLMLHRELNRESREKLFENGELLMTKGYVSEITNYHREVVVADEVRGRELLARGYRRVSAVAPDALDPDKTPRSLYVLRGGGLRGYVSGAMSFTGKQAAGSRARNQEVLDLEDWKANQEDLRAMQKAKQARINDLFNPQPDFDPAQVAKSRTFAVPILNARGDVAGYRYRMRRDTRDDVNVLQRENRMDKVLGQMAGSIFDKSTVTEQNTQVVQALRDQYLADYHRNSRQYVEIAPDSPVPAHQDVWRMIPEETREAIGDIWGRDAKGRPVGITVRKDMLDKTFGYRKLSLSTLFEEDPRTQHMAERFFRELLTYVFGQKAGLRVRQGEEAWETVVGMAKSNIVIKSYTTLKNNVISNFSGLIWAGVPIRDIIYHHRVALKGVTEYQKHSAELAKLQYQLRAGVAPGKAGEMKRRIIELEDTLTRNPVKEAMDLGMMPTIVEDVAAEDDPYSYESNFGEFVSKRTQWIHPLVKSTAKTVLMTKDTKLFQALNYGTQVSDFLARYTLYQHLVNHKKTPMPKAEAALKASEMFVYYDTPSHRKVQYMNDMGFFMFTKYYLRIQKIIAQLYQDKPGRALGMVLMGQYFDNLPLLMDASMVTNPHSPLGMGALAFPSTLDDLATVKLGTGLFN